jgi:hypothetical protein
MLKIVFEGNISPFYSSDVLLTQGQLVKLDPANVGKIIVAGAGDPVYGIVAQDVIAANIDNYKLDSVTHKARVGDKVGVYFGGGEYITNQFVGNITAPGTPLYAGASGQLVATVSGSVVAIAETIGNSATAGSEIRIKYVLD